MRRLEPEEIENQLFPIARRGYDTDKVDAFLRVVAEFYRGALRAAEAEVAVAPARAPAPEPPPARRSFDRLGDQIAAVLGTAEQAAEELRLNAERDAQHMRRVAADEAAETTQAATNQLALARQLKANTQQEVAAMLSEAQEEAARQKQDAHAVAAQLEENARERAARTEQAAATRLDEVAAEARRRYDQLASASEQSIENISSIEALLARAREELAIDRLTTRAAGFPSESALDSDTRGPAPEARPRESERREPEPQLAADVPADVEATWVADEPEATEPAATESVDFLPEEDTASTAVASYADDAVVEDAARKVEETLAEAMAVKPAPPRRRGAGSGTRPRAASRRASSKSVPSARSGPPPDQS